MSERLTPRCDFCNIEMIDGQCPECFSIRLPELWRRQDMAETLTRHGSQLTEVRGDPLLKKRRRAA